MVSTARRYTIADLELMPDDGKRREVIAGVLYVARIPHYEHQAICAELALELGLWNRAAGLGRVSVGPGIVFAEDDGVAPDVVWASHARLAAGLDEAGHFTIAPDLLVEVLSPGRANLRRDRVAKLDLYRRRAVPEYWIVDRRARRIDVYRGEGLPLVASLGEADTLESPLLPGLAIPLARLFADLSPSGAVLHGP